MADLVVIVPSRGRPQAIRELRDAFEQTCIADTLLAVALDESDPTLLQYDIAGDDRYRAIPCGSATMVEALNEVAQLVVAGGLGGFVRLDGETVDRDGNPSPPPFAVGFCGDDHRPRSKSWDERYLDALRELGTGMVYGDDLLQRQNLPTQIAMTSDIVRALGWMAPPDLVHLGVDNWWLELGRAAGCIRYLPDVVIEHMHPVAGKADWDDGHRRVNHPAMYQRDLATLARLRALELPGAVAKVKALRGER